MGSVQTTRCQTCQAIVNPAWNTCAACGSPLTSTEIVIEPAALNARPVFWERTGEIVGPGKPEFLAKVGSGPKESYWVIVAYDGLPVWINSTVLRSKKAYETQIKPRPFEQIEEPR